MSHMRRNIGLAWLDLPLSPPLIEIKTSSRQHEATAK